MNMLLDNLWWIIPAVVVVGTILLGISDVARLSAGRIWAISSVCFRESLRRRVLFVLPLAILGILAVSAFQKPVDVQDAIRQQLKFCIFASGMLVVLTVLILACTNLPREIENRVIYTIVTKPTTRLEIVIGKVLGFARVSGLVLLIMGLFTVIYLGISTVRYQSIIAARLKSGDVQSWEKSSFEHYQEFGLLSAKKLSGPVFSGTFAELPDLSSTASDVRWFRDANDGDILIPFRPDPQLLGAILASDEKDPNAPHLAISVDLYTRVAAPLHSARRAEVPTVPTPLLEAPVIRTLTSISIYGQYAESLIDSGALGGRDRPLIAKADGSPTRVTLTVPRQFILPLSQQRSISIQVGHVTAENELGVGPSAATIFLADANGNPLGVDGKPAKLESLADPVVPSRQLVIFRGKQGRSGLQVRGEAKGAGGVALYRYRGAPIPASVTGDMSVEMSVGVERDAPETETDKDDSTHLVLSFRNLATPDAPPITVDGYPENNRTLYLTVPAAAMAGGNFDVSVTCLSTGHWFTAGGSSSLYVVANREPFIFNLFKSMVILWMMSLLVITTAVCCSTFLSWPIAVVLTLVVLLARWGVVQLGDSIESGIGNQVATQLFGSDSRADPAAHVAVSRSVEALSGALRTVSQVLPDITQFSALEAIERGLQVPLVVLANSGIVLALFGLPLLAFAYVFLRYKEVAP